MLSPYFLLSLTNSTISGLFSHAQHHCQPSPSPAPVNATSSSSATDPTPPLTMYSLSFVVFLVTISSKQICASRTTFAGSYHVCSNFRTSFRVLANGAILNSPRFQTATQEYATTKAGMKHNGRTLNGTSLSMAGRASTSRFVLGRLYRVFRQH